MIITEGFTAGKRRRPAPLDDGRALGVLAPEDELVFLAIHAASCRAPRDAPVEILNVSYDPTREFYQEIVKLTIIIILIGLLLFAVGLWRHVGWLKIAGIVLAAPIIWVYFVLMFVFLPYILFDSVRRRLKNNH